MKSQAGCSSLVSSFRSFSPEWQLWPAVGVGQPHQPGPFPAVPLLVMLVTAYVGKLPGRMKRLTWLLFGVYVLQADVLIFLRASAPVLSAFHPVMVLIDFALGLTLARQARAIIRADKTAAVPQPQPEGIPGTSFVTQRQPITVCPRRTGSNMTNGYGTPTSFLPLPTGGSFAPPCIDDSWRVLTVTGWAFAGDAGRRSQ